MKLLPVTKLDKRNKTMPKYLMSLCQKIVMPLPFFDLWSIYAPQSEKCISDAWYVKVTFSLVVTFHLTKTENRAKKSPTQLPQYSFE